MLYSCSQLHGIHFQAHRSGFQSIFIVMNHEPGTKKHMPVVHASENPYKQVWMSKEFDFFPHPIQQRPVLGTEFFESSSTG